MNGTDPEQLEERLRQAASHLRYPHVPSIAPRVMSRLPQRASRPWLWAALALIVLAALILVSPARAAVIDFIQVGVVRIFRSQPAPAPVSTPSIQAPVTATPSSGLTPQPPVTPTPTSPLGDLAGETTLADARSRAGFPILLPHYPPGVSQPDRVFLQDLGGSLLLMVWLETDGSGHVRMSLQEIAPGSWAIAKYQPQSVQEVTVNGQQGVWAVGPYLLETRNHSYDARQLVTGNALIWTQHDITYRLETALPLDEALKIAASLEPLP